MRGSWVGCWLVVGCALVGCSNAVTASGGVTADAGDVGIEFQDTAKGTDATAPTDSAATDAVSDVAKDAAPDAIADAIADVVLPQTCPGAAGCSCASGSDCGNGLCLDTPDGKRCAAPCDAGCAAGQTCAKLSGAGGASFAVCIGAWGKLCYPCNATADCAEPGITGSLCVDEGALGSFCGAPCTTATDCPSGYDCQVGQSPEGPKSLQCVRVTTDGSGIGTCSCTAAAKAGGLQTACYAEQKDLSGKVVGKCPGTRTCGPTGLGGCTFVALKPEVCDGVDNDCNGQIDDGAGGCGTGETCSGGKCVGGCTATSCDVNATCSASQGTVSCTCKSGFSGDGKTCAADCALPWGGSIASGQTTTGWQDASVACGASCVSQTRTCSNGVLDGSYGNGSCAVSACPGQCPAVTLQFDWGISGSGPCHVDLPAGTASTWYYTATTDAYLGGVLASCDTASGAWQISQQKCVPANGATTCFKPGTKCDGSGPAVFPYPHCWTCCDSTQPMPGVCN